MLLAGLPVAVEIAPPDAPREHVAALLSACSRALAEAECVLSSDAPERRWRAVAIVTWQGDGRVQVQVGLRKEGRPEWRSRSLDFDAKDEVQERWRTVGFVVGTLSRPELSPDAVDTTTTSTEAPPHAPPLEPLRPEPPSAAGSTRKPASDADDDAADEQEEERGRGARERDNRPARAALEIGAVTGPAFDGLRSGAVLRTRLRATERLRTSVALRYLEHPSGEREVGARWLSASVGVGAAFGTDQFELLLGAEGRGEYVVARTSLGSRQDSVSRLVSGAGLAAAAAWIPTRMLGVFVGGEAVWMFNPKDFEIRGELVESEPSLRFAIEGGLRLRLW